jgi:restriction endonuclease S subunit
MAYIIQNSIHRVRSKNKSVVEYLLYVLYVCHLTGWIKVISNKATIMHFTKEKLENLKIPIQIIPTSEQERIIQRIEDAMNPVYEIQPSLSETITELNSLDQIILARVFK